MNSLVCSPIQDKKAESVFRLITIWPVRAEFCLSQDNEQKRVENVFLYFLFAVKKVSSDSEKVKFLFSSSCASRS
jgi:hypothetical protein